MMKNLIVMFWLFFAASGPGLANPAFVTSTATIESEDGKVEMTDQVYPDGKIERRYQRGNTVLYQSMVRPTSNGFYAEITAGHAMQLGSFSVENGTLTVRDPQGSILWTEALNAPLCLPELSAEFVLAHWDDLVIDGPVVPCVVPIIKARKVAPVQWARLLDTANGQRVVELQPGSFGMRFFLSPTRITFSSDGKRMLTQSGQFETTDDPSGRPSYLEGNGVINTPREAALWSKDRFGGAAAP
jgi:hypothetical protein